MINKKIIITLSLFVLHFFAHAAKPIANFTSNYTYGCSPLNSVIFTSISTGSPTNYFWDFGNGNTSTLQNPSASFINNTSNTLVFTVKLKVSNSSGSDSITKINYITVFAKPTANFSANKVGGCSPDTICFTDLSIKGTGVINHWSWDFGDGNFSSLKNPCNYYTANDTFKVTLVVTDVNGCLNNIVKNKFVTITQCQVVNFKDTAIGTTGVAVTKVNGNWISCHPPLTVNFTDATTPPNSGYTFFWSFGDGNNSTQKNPSHIYTTTGNFSVTEMVTSPSSSVKSVTKINHIYITDIHANFILTGTSSRCAPSIISLQNQTTPDTNSVTYLWNVMPYGPTSTLKNPNLLLSTSGTYDIKLEATYLGCKDAITKTSIVRVFTNPLARFTPIQQNSCTVPYTANFMDASTNAVSWFWDFGDGINSTSVNPSKIYSNFGRYNVKLLVANSQGCKDSVTIFNAVQIEPSGFESSRFIIPKNGCKPLNVSFDLLDTSVVKLTTFNWKLNDSTISTFKNGLITINDTGTFILKSTGTNSYGCTVIHFDTIRVGMPPIPHLGIDKHSACFKDATFIFTDSAKNNPAGTAYLWDFGDKTSNRGDGTFSHKYTDTGTFIISLIATNNGCSSSPIFDSVKVFPPIANIIPPTIFCSNDTLQFVDASIGDNKLLWTFGNGDSSKVRNPKYHFPTDGYFDVILFVTDTVSGCNDMALVNIYIPAPPIVKFTLSDTIICPGSKITFTDQSIPNSNYPITNWYYFFSDGQHSTFKNITLTFNNAGYYSAYLSITDSRGCSHSYKKDSAFYVINLNAKFSVKPDKGCAPLLVTVTDSSTYQFPIKTKTWFWGTGDSTLTDTSHGASYLYSKLPVNQNNGYQLLFKIIDSAGCTATDSKVVRPSFPLPYFSSTMIKKCGYDSVRFAANKNITSGLLPFIFKWNFGNGKSSTVDTSIQKYFGDTVYSIKLIMIDGNGCIDSIAKPLVINSKTPVIGYWSNPTKIDCPGPPVYFFDTSIAGASKIISWQWDFGDRTKSTIKNPARTYINPGVYDLSLRITDSLGCTALLNKPGYIIIGGPVGNYSFTPKIGCTPLNVTFSSTSPNAKKIEWDLGDGIIDTLKNDSHTYMRDGIYIPNVTLTDSNGCKIGIPPKDTIVVYPLPSPDFIANAYNICKGGTITFLDKTTSPNHIPIKSFKWNFGDGDSVLFPGPNCNQIFYRYLIAGIYTLSLTVTDTLGCTNSTIKSDILRVNDDTIPPKTPIIYRATVLDNTNVLMEFTKSDEPDWAKYTIYYNYVGTKNPQSKISVSNMIDTTFIETNLNTLKNVYSYIVTATDVCNNESPISFKNTTINVETTPLINAINVYWTTYEGWDSVLRYEIYRQDSLPTNPYNFISSVSKDSLSYIDTNTVCYKQFFYKIKAVQNGGLMQISWSDSSGAVPIYQPAMPPTQNVRATVVNNQNVLLQWRSRKHKLPFTFLVYRAIDDGEPLFYKEFSQLDTFLLDIDVKVAEHSYSYITYLKDNCGGLSLPSNISKTILLKADLEQNDILKYDPIVSWSKYLKWCSGVDHYKVEFYYDSSGGFYTIGNRDSNEFSLTHKYVNLEQREYCYKVTAYQLDSQFIFSESNIACIYTAPRLFAPNVFTVNGDNLNEVFRLGGAFLDTYHILIYNRWGELMFESNDIHNSWDGTFKGSPCQSGVYVYLAEGTGRKGQTITLKGNVTLLR